MHFDLTGTILLVLVVGAVYCAYRLHKKMRPNLRLFWAGLGCYVGWGLFLALVPGHGNFHWPWLFLDAPLNFGWMLFWAWPALLSSWRDSRARWRVTKANWRLMRQAVREARAQRSGS